MSQSTLIVGAAILAFLVWVTLNGHLGNYLSDLGIGGSAASAGGSASNVNSGPGAPLPSQLAAGNMVNNSYNPMSWLLNGTLPQYTAPIGPTQ